MARVLLELSLRGANWPGSEKAVVVVVVVIFFQYNQSIDIVDELVLNRNSMIHRLVIIL